MPAAAGPAMAGFVGVAAAAAGFALSAVSHPYPWSVWLPVQCVGLSFVAAGVVGWARQPENGSGRLMAAVGITWYVGDLQLSTNQALFAVGFCLFYVPAAVFAHMILALPTGRLAGRADCAVVGALYLAVSLPQVPRYVSESPVEPQIWGSMDNMSMWAPVGSVSGGVLTLAAFGLVVRRWWTAGRAARRMLAALWSTGIVGGGIALVWIGATLAHVSPGTQRALLFLFAVALVFTPFAILTGLLRVRLARLQVANLVLQVEAAAEPRRLRDALAETLGDPTLQVWFRLPDGGYADPDGRVREEVPIDGHASTAVDCRGERLAVLVHDPALRDQGSLVEAVVATARLALENARLLAAQRAQLEEVRASRGRIVAAADEERHRIQRDLHDGAQHKLLAISLLIGRARNELPVTTTTATTFRHLGTAAVQLQDVIRELRQLIEGIDPPALTEQGLMAIVETLAERAPIPVEYDVPPQRWPVSVERAAYFVINEGLTNIYKHAGASRAVVRVESTADSLVLSVIDDGTGEADVDRGSGLSGLQDRVSAVGGTLVIDSRPGAGTCLRAELPCGS
ncbi:signal transduction histidine kinase [Couchioplanes caeruleus]|nr:signal transduction histidine kinase [Couchioplanes caeruleus]